jgi:RNA polymerase sigma-70 factor, ECF subfamily
MDNKVFKQFFDEYYQPVLHYCFTIVKHSDEAKDIVQQAFVSLWQKRQRINIPVAARAYLYKTVYNASLDFLKHEAVKQKYAKHIQAGTALWSSYEDEREKEVQLKIRKAIQQLPEPCRTVFNMSRFENKRYREIAAALGMPEKKIENQMGKALKLLRETLKELLPLMAALIIY